MPTGSLHRRARSAIRRVGVAVAVWSSAGWPSACCRPNVRSDSGGDPRHASGQPRTSPLTDRPSSRTVPVGIPMTIGGSLPSWSASSYLVAAERASRPRQRSWDESPAYQWSSSTRIFGTRRSCRCPWTIGCADSRSWRRRLSGSWTGTWGPTTPQLPDWQELTPSSSSTSRWCVAPGARPVDHGRGGTSGGGCSRGATARVPRSCERFPHTPSVRPYTLFAPPGSSELFCSPQQRGVLRPSNQGRSRNVPTITVPAGGVDSNIVGVTATGSPAAVGWQPCSERRTKRMPAFAADPGRRPATSASIRA